MAKLLVDSFEARDRQVKMLMESMQYYMIEVN